MSVIYPFRNVKTSIDQAECEICHERVPRSEAYSVVTDGSVSGFVCSDCFLMLDQEPQRKEG